MKVKQIVFNYLQDLAEAGLPIHKPAFIWNLCNSSKDFKLPPKKLCNSTVKGGLLFPGQSGSMKPIKVTIEGKARDIAVGVIDKCQKEIREVLGETFRKNAIVMITVAKSVAAAVRVSWNRQLFFLVASILEEGAKDAVEGKQDRKQIPSVRDMLTALYSEDAKMEIELSFEEECEWGLGKDAEEQFKRQMGKISASEFTFPGSMKGTVDGIKKVWESASDYNKRTDFDDVGKILKARSDLIELWMKKYPGWPGWKAYPKQQKRHRIYISNTALRTDLIFEKICVEGGLRTHSEDSSLTYANEKIKEKIEEKMKEEEKKKTNKKKLQKIEDRLKVLKARVKGFPEKKGLWENLFVGRTGFDTQRKKLDDLEGIVTDGVCLLLSGTRSMEHKKINTATWRIGRKLVKEDKMLEEYNTGSTYKDMNNLWDFIKEQTSVEPKDWWDTVWKNNDEDQVEFVERTEFNKHKKNTIKYKKGELRGMLPVEVFAELLGTLKVGGKVNLLPLDPGNKKIIAGTITRVERVEDGFTLSHDPLSISSKEYNACMSRYNRGTDRSHYVKNDIKAAKRRRHNEIRKKQLLFKFLKKIQDWYLFIYLLFFFYFFFHFFIFYFYFLLFIYFYCSCPEDVPTVCLFGDVNISGGFGYSKGPHKQIRKFLAEFMPVVEIDEYNTSKCCPICGDHTVYCKDIIKASKVTDVEDLMSTLIKKRAEELGLLNFNQRKGRVYMEENSTEIRTKVCLSTDPIHKNNKYRFYDRDTGAAINFVNIVIALATSKKRPENMRKPGEASSSSDGGKPKDGGQNHQSVFSQCLNTD